MNKKACIVVSVLLMLMAFATLVHAAPTTATTGSAANPFQLPSIDLKIGGGGAQSKDYVASLQILIILTLLSLAPAALIMMTAFTRIIIVLAMVRNALSIQRMPPNQVLVGLAIFLTIFIMTPVFSEINNNALKPYLAGKINQDTAIHNTMQPLRTFMFAQTREKDLALFVQASGNTRPKSQDDVSTFVLIPAFVISELKTAFQIGFMIFLPFIIIDMIVASVLMSLGMMMLPPSMISLPFKLLLFILVDGWYLTVKSLIMTFH